MGVSVARDEAPPSGTGTAHAASVLLHLVRREWVSRQRFTFLGWGWPLLRQLVQLAVLSFVFTQAVDLGVDDYPAFVFSGLIAWSWFASGTSGAAWMLIRNRHFLLQPRTPVAVLPLVAVLVPAIDLLVALPVLVALLLLVGDGLSATALLLAPLLLLQGAFMAAVGWLVAALGVVARDVPPIVDVVIATLFYLTPVFYGLGQVPDPYDALLALNPMSVLIESYRDVLLDGRVPPLGPLAAVAGATAIVGVVGVTVFRRLQGRFLDAL